MVLYTFLPFGKFLRLFKNLCLKYLAKNLILIRVKTKSTHFCIPSVFFSACCYFLIFLSHGPNSFVDMDYYIFRKSRDI